jgi:hypothetical protein
MFSILDTPDIQVPFEFKEFLKLLSENGVRVLLVGG